MAVAEGIEWRVALPARRAAIPGPILAGLPPELGELIDRSDEHLRGYFTDRWSRVPAWCSPLRDHLLAFRSASLVVGLGRALVELSFSATPSTPIAWSKRPWSSPWALDRGAALAYLAERGESGDDLDGDGEVWIAVEDALLAAQLDEGAELAAGPEDADVLGCWVPAAAEGGRAVAALRPLGADQGDLGAFLGAFAGVSGSPPGVAGSFSSAEDVRPVVDDPYLGAFPGASAWNQAIPIFMARNGDRVLARPDGSAGWAVVTERRLEPRWPTLGDLVRTYVATSVAGGVFDAHDSRGR